MAWGAPSSAAGHTTPGAPRICARLFGKRSCLNGLHASSIRGDVGTRRPTNRRTEWSRTFRVALPKLPKGGQELSVVKRSASVLALVLKLPMIAISASKKLYPLLAQSLGRASGDAMSRNAKTSRVDHDKGKLCRWAKPLSAAVSRNAGRDTSARCLRRRQ